MTAKEKIAEADFNLDKVRHIPFLDPTFKFLLSNFLNSAQSIFYHLLEDYNQKFQLGLTGNYDKENFKERAKELNNEKALEFIRWYADELNKIKQNKDFGFLTEKRHINIHKESVMPTLFTIADYTPRTFSGGGTHSIPINFHNATTSFEENRDENLRFVCVSFFTQIKKFVISTFEKFDS